MASSDILPPLDEFDLTEFDSLNIDEPEIEIQNRIYPARPTSPPLRAPAYALRGLDRSGNKALDSALEKLGFETRAYFANENGSEILLLYGVDSAGYQIFICMDQEGLISPDSTLINLTDEDKPRLHLADKDLQVVQLLIDGLGYFQQPGLLYYVKRNSQRVWSITSRNDRPAASDMPIPVVLYTTLISNPHQVQINVRQAIDLILGDQYARVMNNLNTLEERAQLYNRIYEQQLTVSRRTLQSLYLSLGQLYINRASYNRKFNEENRQSLKESISYKDWSELSARQQKKFSQLATEALSVPISNIDKPKLKQVNLNIRERIDKIEHAMVLIQESMRILTNIDLDVVNDNLRELESIYSNSRQIV